MKPNDEFLISMGSRICKERKRLCLSQEALAEMIDVSPQTISTAERGEKAMRPESIYKLSKIFGCSTDYLFSGAKTELDKSLLFQRIDSLSQSELDVLKKITDILIRK